MVDTSLWMTVRQAAEALGVTRKHVYVLAERGTLRHWQDPRYKRGGFYVSRQDVDALATALAAARPS